MTVVRRFDVGNLRKVVRTPQGGIRVQAVLTRSGVFEYKNPDGSPRLEYRPEEEVFREDSLDTLRGAPVTNLHPEQMVTPDNYRSLAVGHVSTAPSREGNLVVAELTIQDKETIELIESGQRREISCGYDCQIEMQSGTAPDGTRFDAVQKSVGYNHVAVVPKGRAGRVVALRLDAEGNQTAPEGDEETPMDKMELIGGVEYEVGTPAHTAAAERRDSEKTAQQADLDKLTAERDALRSQVEELTQRLDSVGEQVTEAVKVRVGLIKRADKAGVEVREDMSDHEVRVALLGKILPAVSLEGKSDDYIQAALDIAMEGGTGNAADVRKDAVQARKGARLDAETQNQEPPHVAARNKMMKRGRKAHLTPA